MNNKDKDIHQFKAGEVTYEVFISPSEDEEYIELYEQKNPSEGLTFSSNKQLISFVNFLTDLVEEEVIENGNS